MSSATATAAGTPLWRAALHGDSFLMGIDAAVPKGGQRVPCKTPAMVFGPGGLLAAQAGLIVQQLTAGPAPRAVGSLMEPAGRCAEVGGSAAPQDDQHQ